MSVRTDKEIWERIRREKAATAPGKTADWRASVGLVPQPVNDETPAPIWADKKDVPTV